MERNCQVGRHSHEGAHRVGAAQTASQGCRLFFLRRSAVRWPLLRYTTPGECAQAAMSPRVANERTTARAGIWSALATARGEPTWLQDGQMDRAYRVCGVRKNARRRRGR